MAIGRKTGGRQKGTSNKATVERRTAIQTALADLTPDQIDRITPKEVMLGIMRMSLRSGDVNMAFMAAEKAAPYVHAKLSSMDLSASIKSEHELTDAELALIASAGSGGDFEAPGYPEESGDLVH